MRDQAQFKALVQAKMRQQQHALTIRRQKRRALYISFTMLAVVVCIFSLFAWHPSLEMPRFFLSSTDESALQQNSSASDESLTGNAMLPQEENASDTESSLTAEEISPSKQESSSSAGEASEEKNAQITDSAAQSQPQGATDNNTNNSAQPDGIEDSVISPTDADKIIVLLPPTEPNGAGTAVEITQPERIGQYCNLLDDLAGFALPLQEDSNSALMEILFYKEDRAFYTIRITEDLRMIRYGSAQDEVTLTNAQYKQLLDFVS